VTCWDFSAGFSVDLTATASAPGAADCAASDSGTVNVTVNIQPAVSIVDVSEDKSFCSPEGPLTFTYNVSSGPANTPVDVSLDAPAAAGCVLSNATGMSPTSKGFGIHNRVSRTRVCNSYTCVTPVRAGQSRQSAQCCFHGPILPDGAAFE
jgi:hypothetical protein